MLVVVDRTTHTQRCGQPTDSGGVSVPRTQFVITRLLLGLLKVSFSVKEHVMELFGPPSFNGGDGVVLDSRPSNSN